MRFPGVPFPIPAGMLQKYENVFWGGGFLRVGV